MKLNELIKDLPIKIISGEQNLEISGISSNSQQIKPGYLFIAKKGLTHNGTKFIPDAIKRGAVAILTGETLKNISPTVSILGTNDVVKQESKIANKYYNYPSNQLFMVAITGTNGKTTTSYLIKHILDNINLPCGLIGTIEYSIGNEFYKSTMTTPDIITNQKLLLDNLNKNNRAMVMEVSSHALDQNRVRGIKYDAAIFSNFSQDHLDYHESMENYFDAKAKLFHEYNIKTAILNADDENHKKLINKTTNNITYGIKSKADVMAKNINFTKQGTSFTISHNDKTELFTTNLIGEFNLYNILSAIALGISKNIPLNKLAKIISNFNGVRGRVEKIPNRFKLNCYVDYAHTEDALKNVLKTLIKLKGNGRIITIFGCGGDRDKDKRPKMAKVSEQLSDYSIITSDNPRNEDPMKICTEIASGFVSKTNYLIEIDRKQAIKKAMEIATTEDIILIAGKGHETVQIFKENVLEFDDYKIVMNL